MEGRRETVFFSAYTKLFREGLLKKKNPLLLRIFLSAVAPSVRVCELGEGRCSSAEIHTGFHSKGLGLRQHTGFLIFW